MDTRRARNGGPDTMRPFGPTDPVGDTRSEDAERHKGARSSRSIWVPLIFGLVGLILGLAAGWWLFQDDWQAPAPIIIDLAGGRYVSLGDSYSAGEGLDPWETGTQNPPSGNRCHRSRIWAYSRLLLFTNEGGRHHRACSGAVIANVYQTPQKHEGVIDEQDLQITPQIEGPDVALVTVTMSGNDAGFSRVLKTCLKNSECPDRRYVDIDKQVYPTLRAWAEIRLPRIRDHLVDLFGDLRVSFPNARILAIGYPALFPVEKPPISEDPGGICQAFFSRWDATERAAIRDWGAQLNRHIYGATRDAGAEIEFVDLAAPFAGHEACGASGPWLRAVGLLTAPARDGSFHPRRVGQAMIARIVSCHLDVYGSAIEWASGDEIARLAMAGCVAGQSVGLSEIAASEAPPEGGDAGG